MSFKNWPNRVQNSQNTGLGIGPYDHVEYTYSNTNLLTSADYYLGANSSTANSTLLIATVEYTYDGNDNLITITRTYGPEV